MKRPLIFFILVLSVFYSIGQPAQMLEKGTSGIGCSFNIASQTGIRQSGFALGYSHKGIADISVIYAMTYLDQSRIGLLKNSSTGTMAGLEADFWPLRKEFNDRFYFKTGILAGISEVRYDDLTFWDNGSHSYYKTSSNRLYYGGVESLLNIALFKHLVVQPTVSVTYILGTEKYKQSFYLGSQKYDDLIISGGIVVGYKTKTGATIGLGFSNNVLSLDETNTAVYGLEVALPL